MLEHSSIPALQVANFGAATQTADANAQAANQPNNFVEQASGNPPAATQDGFHNGQAINEIVVSARQGNGASFFGFLREEGINVLLRTGQSIGGAGQILLGGSICYGSGGLACTVGAIIGVKGIDNFQSGIRGTDSISQQLLTDFTGSENAGILINAGIDLGTSIGGLTRSVPKINELGNPTKNLFFRDPANFEPAINQATRNALTIEAFSSGTSIYGTVE